MLRTFRVPGDSAHRDKIVSYQVGRVDPGRRLLGSRVVGDAGPRLARSGREPDLVRAMAACGEVMQ